jgi:hypothetical protein
MYYWQLGLVRVAATIVLIGILTDFSCVLSVETVEKNFVPTLPIIFAGKKPGFVTPKFVPVVMGSTVVTLGLIGSLWKMLRDSVRLCFHCDPRLSKSSVHDSVREESSLSIVHVPNV